MSTDTERRRIRRSQFAVVLVLSSANDTFQRKYLVVPFAPEVIKLGRQTNTKSTANADNGFFDSRVLSRQHAEIWADKTTGKVWIRDCKSSNGTYINNHRLSPENTESEAFELKKNDNLDLGIDIMSSDEKEKVYKRISAKVEKISMLPLNVFNSQPKPDRNRPSISRSPSLETLKSANTNVELRNSDAIFGNTLESMALTHVNTTTGGSMVKEDVKLHVDFEQAAKRLVSEIRSVRADTAKIKSITSLLLDIKRVANETEHQDNVERQKLIDIKRDLQERTAEKNKSLKSASLAALKAENTRIRAELSRLKRGMNGSDSIANVNTQVGGGNANGNIEFDRQTKEKHDRRHIQNNFFTLIGTAILVTLSGIWVMYFFNPPMAPSNSNSIPRL